ncbi:MAG TPA: alpha/beta hydrolase, partial [Gemmatimonadales bacterium]|nr:alpha/beta hydrolase [Gemmatimonadales bacterium]
EGSPTVILEAAGLGWSLYWNRVQPDLAKVTRVCSYDRAGLGWSESGPSPRTGQRTAGELHTLLTRAGIAGPYVLVGHSLGGFIVRLYRQTHPADVAGMVLVDAGHERQFEEEEFRKFVAPGKIAFPIVGAVTSLGVTRLLMAFDLLPPLFAKQEEQVTDEIRPMLRAGWAQTRYFATMADEAAALEETCLQVRRADPLGDLPLTILTATGPIWWPDMPSDLDQVRFRRMWLQWQTNLTKLSTNSRQVFADQSSHFINFDQPELVVGAVREMVERLPQKPAGNM